MLPVKLTTAAARLVAHFNRMDRRRLRLGAEVAPLTYADFVFYGQLTGFRLSAWEIEMIEMLDDIHLSWYCNRQALLMEALSK
jgi:hypothetical protein